MHITLDLATGLSAQHFVMPFTLLDASFQEELSKLEPNRNGTAVYRPCHLSDATDEMLIQSFGQYALRRRWVKEKLKKEGSSISQVRSQIVNQRLSKNSTAKVLTEAIRKLALCDEVQVQHALSRFRSIGISHVALLLDREETQDAERLSKIVGRFSARTRHHPGS